MYKNKITFYGWHAWGLDVATFMLVRCDLRAEPDYPRGLITHLTCMCIVEEVVSSINEN